MPQSIRQKGDNLYITLYLPGRYRATNIYRRVTSPQEALLVYAHDIFRYMLLFKALSEWEQIPHRVYYINECPEDYVAEANTKRGDVVLTKWCLEQDRDEVEDTIIHEFCHFIHSNDGHGDKWKQEMKNFGASPFPYSKTENLSPARLKYNV